jgi:hypothetical protein
LVALFFALDAENKDDRLIYAAKYSHFVHNVETGDISPFECVRVGRFSPPLLFERMRAQRGIFTIHPDPTKIFYREGMQVIRIPNEHVKRFRKRLFKYGVDYWHIYPDGEGLGKQLRWQFQNKIGLGSLFIKTKSAA